MSGEDGSSTSIPAGVSFTDLSSNAWEPSVFLGSQAEDEEVLLLRAPPRVELEADGPPAGMQFALPEWAEPWSLRHFSARDAATFAAREAQGLPPLPRSPPTPPQSDHGDETMRKKRKTGGDDVEGSHDEQQNGGGHAGDTMELDDGGNDAPEPSSPTPRSSTCDLASMQENFPSQPVSKKLHPWLKLLRRLARNPAGAFSEAEIENLNRALLQYRSFLHSATDEQLASLSGEDEDRVADLVAERRSSRRKRRAVAMDYRLLGEQGTTGFEAEREFHLARPQIGSASFESSEILVGDEYQCAVPVWTGELPDDAERERELARSGELLWTPERDSDDTRAFIHDTIGIMEDLRLSQIQRRYPSALGTRNLDIPQAHKATRADLRLWPSVGTVEERLLVLVSKCRSPSHAQELFLAVLMMRKKAREWATMDLRCEVDGLSALRAPSERQYWKLPAGKDSVATARCVLLIRNLIEEPAMLQEIGGEWLRSEVDAFARACARGAPKPLDIACRVPSRSRAELVAYYYNVACRFDGANPDHYWADTAEKSAENATEKTGNKAHNSANGDHGKGLIGTSTPKTPAGKGKARGDSSSGSSQKQSASKPARSKAPLFDENGRSLRLPRKNKEDAVVKVDVDKLVTPDTFEGIPTAAMKLTKEREDFFHQLMEFLLSKDIKFSRPVFLGHREVDLFVLYHEVMAVGGCQVIHEHKVWSYISRCLDLPKTCTSAGNSLNSMYLRLLYDFAEFVGFKSWDPSVESCNNDLYDDK